MFLKHCLAPIDFTKTVTETSKFEKNGNAKCSSNGQFSPLTTGKKILQKTLNGKN